MIKVLAWIYVVVMFIITFPIGMLLFTIATNTTFTGDEPPKWFTAFMNLIIWPLNKLKI